jgi:AcrR family transcriptional regulator
MDPETVKLDQRERLRTAMVELIAAKGYPAVRISDLARLAHVSPPTLYSLYADKEELFMGAYEDVAGRVGTAIASAAPSEDGDRLTAAMSAFAELAVREPQAVSLLVTGAFGAGPRALARRRATIAMLEAYINANRSPGVAPDGGDLTVKALLGGVREITASRLRDGRHGELPGLAAPLAEWGRRYPVQLPAGLSVPPCRRAEGSCATPSERARRAEGRLPSGRSEMPRTMILKSQQERIVDATAAIVAEKGLGALTIPEIARRANVSNQTFYSIYPSKHDAFLGAQKVGMHQALRVSVEAYMAEQGDWPKAIAAGLRALLGYLASEPAHAHLTLVDTFAASPEAIAIRSAAMDAFRVYLAPGFPIAGERAPQPIVAEAVVGGIWQILHHYIESDSAAELPRVAPQLTYFALLPFLGGQRAAEAALS